MKRCIFRSRRRVGLCEFSDRLFFHRSRSRRRSSPNSRAAELYDRKSSVTNRSGPKAYFFRSLRISFSSACCFAWTGPAHRRVFVHRGGEDRPELQWILERHLAGRDLRIDLRDVLHVRFFWRWRSRRILLGATARTGWLAHPSLLWREDCQTTPFAVECVRQVLGSERGGFLGLLSGRGRARVRLLQLAADRALPSSPGRGRDPQNQGRKT